MTTAQPKQPNQDEETKRGRKPTGRNRDCSVQIRVSAEELELLKKLSAESHCSISTLIRRTLNTHTTKAASQPGAKAVDLKGSIVFLSQKEAKELYSLLAEHLIQWEVDQRLSQQSGHKENQ